MPNWVELLNLHAALLPLLGAFYIIQLPSHPERKVAKPILLGLLVTLGSWVQTGTLSGLLQGVLYGLSTFGAAMAAPGRWWNERRRGGKSVWKVIGWGVVFGLVQVGMELLFGLMVRGTVEESSMRALLAGSPWPWLFPAGAAVAAGIYEELVYRRLADVWLSRWFPGWVVALLSSLLWACTHTAAGVSPWYVQVLELGLVVGPLSYAFYRRFGLLAVMVAHGAYNLGAALMALL
ncbi:CPBP family intramembrane glutamic endopeptidase [Tumebacillus flagellatus]|uniref:CAAX prenyl protease 2/Lysostaphin resistance protein A-like domain-containing protein n=1 Tax=Tumebacillus flagellatus TaxID=1157490 RepID=A0A074LSU5_9BACL|nr:type II CAAX endopeptidase family protein [Tumebacillus flagellatus]KEO85226.1 hypothetical protein EL26_01315 [Tumebacillus flagellatus]